MDAATPLRSLVLVDQAVHDETVEGIEKRPPALQGGIVAEGRDADLVLLNDNPLDDINNSNRIHGVMLRGAWYSSTDLNARLEQYVIQDGR